MYKILLVGKFNTTFQFLHKTLDEHFNVHLCPDQVDLFRSVMTMKNPDFILITFNEISNECEDILREISNKYKKIPVFCLGTSYEHTRFTRFTGDEQFTNFYTPMGNDIIVTAILSKLKGKVEEQKLSSDLNTKKILLVDDDSLQLKIIETLIPPYCEVVTALSGVEALAQIGRKIPDIIFLDYEMPIWDGKMTLQMIRELNIGKNIPVVFLTGVHDREHIDAVLKLKPSGYILKPATKDVIEKTLNKILNSFSNYR